MTELEYLDRQQRLACGSLRRTLLPDGDLETTLNTVAESAERRPWTSVGVALAVGGLAGAISGRLSLPVLLRALRLVGGPLRSVLRGP